jgi:hypothetical protein
MMWAMQLKGVSPLAKLIAIYIGDNCDPENNPSLVHISTLIEFTGAGRLDVIAALGELPHHGLRAELRDKDTFWIAGLREFDPPWRSTK